MIKEIISGRKEDASIFLHCIGGNSIIQIYYYKEDDIIQKIIGLKYYGNISKKENINYNHFQFSENLFYNFINKLEEFVTSKNMGNVYMNHYDDILQLSRNNVNEYIIGRAKSLKDAQKRNYIWKVEFKDDEAIDLLDKLKNIKAQIINDKYMSNCTNTNAGSENKEVPSTYIKDVS